MTHNAPSLPQKLTDALNSFNAFVNQYPGCSPSPALVDWLENIDIAAGEIQQQAKNARTELQSREGVAR